VVELHLSELLLEVLLCLCQCLGIHFSYFFDLHKLSVFIEITSYNKLSLNRQFLGCEAKSLLSDVEAYTLNLEKDTTRSHGSYPSCGITLTLTHTYVSRLTCDRFVGEDSDPDLTLTLHVTVYSNTGCLNLTAVDPFCLKCLDAERAESQLCASVGVAFVTTSVLRSSIFYSFWL